MSALVRLLGGLLLCPSLLDQDLQASAEAGGGVHPAEEERLARPGNLPTLRLRQGPFLQGVERRDILVQVQAPHVPEDLKLEAAAVCVFLFFFFTFISFFKGRVVATLKGVTETEQNAWARTLAIRHADGSRGLLQCVCCERSLPAPTFKTCAFQRER